MLSLLPDRLQVRLINTQLLLAVLILDELKHLLIAELEHPKVGGGVCQLVQ